MIRRITALILTFFLGVQTVSFAATSNSIRHETFTNEYMPGATEYNLDLSDFSYVNNGELSEKIGKKRIKLAENGSVVYKFYLPFNSTGMEIKTFPYSATKVTVSMGGETVSQDLIGFTAHNLDGANPNFAITFEKTKLMGDAELAISATNPVMITDVVFLKEKRSTTGGGDNAPMPKLSDYEQALYTSVVIKSDSPVIKVNNGIRYINYDNPKETPIVEDGKMYMPLSSFARALSCYYEENLSKGWMLLRNKTASAEIVMKDGKLYRQSNLGNYSEIENVVKQRNEKYYVPVRYFAEIMGKSVSYRDGFTVIDYRDLARKALEDPVFSQLKAEFENYKSDTLGGRVYHVAKSENASDSNDGSESSPFLTLNKAGEVAAAGDKVIVHNGTYREVFAPKNDGTASNPIIFEAAEGENPVISALEEVGAPEGTEGEMLVYNTGIDLGDGRNMVFFEGEAIAEARHPNSHTSKRPLPDIELGPLWQTQGNIQVMGNNRPWYDWGPEAENYAVSDTDLDQENDFWKGGTLVTQHGEGWILATAKILSSEKGRVNLGNPNEETCTINWWYPSHRELDYAYITGTKNAVDMPGEWYAEGGKLWIIPPEGQTADTLKLQVKARQLCIDLNDRSYVQLKNISTIGGGTRMNRSKMCVLNGGSYRYISHYTFSLDQWCGYADDAMRYGNNGMPQRGESGIYLGGTSCAVINTDIQWSAAAGIYSSGTYSYVENNLIEDCGYMGSYVAGFYDSWAGTDDIRTPRSGNLVVNNTIDKVGRAMYHMEMAQQGWNIAEGSTPYLPTEVAYNDLKNGSITSRDTGVVYMFGAVMGSDRKHHDIHHNVVSDSWSCDGFNAGIYYDNYIKEADCHDNVVLSTHENSKFSDGKGVFVQSKANFPNAYANVDTWNNRVKNLVPNGKDELTTDDYPSFKPFRSGQCKNDEEYLVNYNSFNPNAKDCSADNASLGDGVTLENGIAKFSGNNQTVTFPAVDFGSDKNALDIMFTTDYANTGDKIEISVDGAKAYVVAYGEARDESKYNSIRASFDNIKGVHRVSIKTLSFKSLGIVKVKAVSDTEIVSDGIIGKTYFGHFDEVVKQNPGQPVTRKFLGDGNAAHQGIMNGWGEQVVIRYDNVGVEKDVNKLIVAAGSDQKWANGVISVRIGSADAEPIGSVEVFPRSGWDVKQTMEVPLSKTLRKGTYTVYVTFHKSGSCNDCWYFGFKE